MENTLTNGVVIKLDKDNFIATITISKDAKGDISIPPFVEYESMKFVVTQIDDYAFSQNSSLISISIPSSVRFIGESAFYKCEQLKTILFVSDPERDSLLEEIGNFSFGDCINLETVSPIPSSVRRIGNSSFSNCTKLQSISIEMTTKSGSPPLLEEIGNGSFYSCTSLKSISIIPSTVRKIGESAFYKCSNLKSITFGSSEESKESSLKEICKFAFADCIHLETVSKIPASVYRIGESSFANCTSLKLLSFSSYESVLEEIGNESFYSCTSLESVTFFPSSVRKIGKHAFCKCDKLKSFQFGPEIHPNAASLEEISDFCFCDCLSLEKVTSVPLTLKKFGNSSFYKCESLRLLTFGSSSDGQRLNRLEVIGNEAFYCCFNLELVIMIPSSVRFIGNGSFFQCRSLKLIIFEPESSSLEMIGSKAFYECNNLLSVTMIPATVRMIGESSFFKCESLKSVTFASAHQTGIVHPELTEIGAKSFCECSSLESITNIPATVRKIGKKCFSKCFLLNTLNFALIDGLTTLPLLEEIGNSIFNDCRSLESVFIIPAAVKRIGKSAFRNCERLKALKFECVSGETVKSCLDEIDENCCNGCYSLEKVENVPSRLRKIGAKAFFNCTKLSSFGFDVNPSSSCLPLLRFIGEHAFANCSSLESFKSTSKVPLLIGHSCFQNDRLLGAVVCHSESVCLGSLAFGGCEILSFTYFPNAKMLSVAEAAFDGVPESFEIFVPTDLELNGVGIEKVKNGIRNDQEPKDVNNNK